jgi:hypothetical protein
VATKVKKPRLTAAQRHARQINRNPLYQPGAPLAGTTLERAANQLTDLQFKPKVAALDQQSATEKRQGTALIDKSAGYYKSIALDEASRLARQQALSGELDTRLKSIDTDTQASLDRAHATRQPAGVGGPGLSGGGDDQVTAELAAQRARAASTASAYRTGGAAESGNWEGLANSMAGARAFHGQEATRDLTTRLANRMAAIGQEKKVLLASRGDQATKNLLGLRKSSFEDIATIKGLGLKQSAIDSAAAQSAAKLQSAQSIAAAHDATTLQAANIKAAKGQKLTPAEKRARRRDAAQRKNQRGPYTPKSGNKPKGEPQASKNTKLSIDNARSSIRRYRSQGLTGPQITKKATRAKIPGVILNAARDLEYLGYISAPNLAALRRAGVKINKYGH